ncbi:hypothetical protein [uncultured Microbacterium sp.]|uniref:hypothetical protein n=1 Tax=uncultured Microbacterium sp. TaxID=191216 RepID=UPI0025ED4649|nr:hypothetical protein [uncultured Microbacterium sp.]
MITARILGETVAVRDRSGHTRYLWVKQVLEGVAVEAARADQARAFFGFTLPTPPVRATTTSPTARPVRDIDERSTNSGAMSLAAARRRRHVRHIVAPTDNPPQAA